MGDFSTMKSLVISDYKRFFSNNRISFFSIAVSCMKDRVLATIVYYRISNYIASLNNPHRVLKRVLRLFLRPRQDIHIHEKAQIGPGLRIYHGSGLVIGKGTVAGKHLTLEHSVTIGNRIGSKRDDWNSFPTLGDNVLVGCGAAILGNVVIGNNAKIGASALVLKDIPDHSTAVGVPARIMENTRKHSSNS